MKKTTLAPQRASTANEKRARLVRVMMEIAALDRTEYRLLRAEMWQSVARSHKRKPSEGLREWSSKSS